MIDYEGDYSTLTVPYTGLVPDTIYRFEIYATKNALDSDIVVLEEKTLSIVRPVNFTWTYSKVSGQDYNLTGTEWNNFCSKINEFRVYKALTEVTFTPWVSGDYPATCFNQAVNALNGLSAYFATGKTIPAAVRSGYVDSIKAGYFTQMSEALNSIV
jgi:hypothetical protein